MLPTLLTRPLVVLPGTGSLLAVASQRFFLLQTASLRRFSSGSTPAVDVAAFNRDGVGIVKNFASAAECKEMIARMGALVDKWDLTQKVEVFRTDAKQVKSQGSSDYFLDSADRVHFFLEPHAVDEETRGLKKGFCKATSMNKVGHGLHQADPVFAKYSQSDKVAHVTKVLGYQDPVLPQSMYIFKQSFIGGEVTSHQDSSFLYTTPKQTCLGLWLALMDSTLDNGCIWARPGSHREPVRRHFARNPAYFAGDKSQPQMEFLEETPGGLQSSDAPWEGTIPEYPGMTKAESLRKAGFVPYPCKAGDLVLIHGQVDHASLDNTSKEPRHTFQLHLVEGPKQGITWSPQNWLQNPVGKPFPSLRKD